MEKISIEVDPFDCQRIVAAELKMALDNYGLDKKARKAYKRVLMDFLTPEEFIDYFGIKTYWRYHDN